MSVWFLFVCFELIPVYSYVLQPCLSEWWFHKFILALLLLFLQVSILLMAGQLGEVKLVVADRHIC